LFLNVVQQRIIKIKRGFANKYGKKLRDFDLVLEK